MITRAVYVSPAQLARCAPGSPLRQLSIRRRTRDDEHDEQVKLFAWCSHPTVVKCWPEMRLLYAIPNWIGVRTAKHGARLKAEGRKKGVPDICLPVRRFPYIGLYLEMKTEDGALSSDQREWIERLRAAGHCVYVARSSELARRFIIDYLAGPLHA